ncbi:MAG TPA: phosphatase PAP2 family protein [Elusimicrobiales bacterium]|nr:phosphatase PAP2 family protein [Elusimicrobiales bacterium]
MKILFPRSRVLAATIALALCACSGAPKLNVKDKGPGRSLNYLDGTAVKHLVAAFPPPPSDGSAQQKEEIELLLARQNSRTERECEIARSQEDATFRDFFPGPDNPFAEPLSPAVDEFFARTGEDVRVACRRLKKHAARRRPHDPRLRPCVTDVGSERSYPSRHTATSYLFAHILSDLVPARSKEFFAAAERGAQYRILAGVHYPSDLQAGRDYAAQLYKEFLKNENFRRDRESLRKYLRK